MISMKSFGFVLATRMLVDEKKKVRYMYREKPDNPQDSGWRFFCGDETDEYVQNPDNLGVYDINSIIQLDGDVVPYLSALPGHAFERDKVDSVFRMSEDFSAGEVE